MSDDLQHILNQSSLLLGKQLFYSLFLSGFVSFFLLKPKPGMHSVIFDMFLRMFLIVFDIYFI